MKFTVTLSETSEFDIFDIHDYVALHDTMVSADRLLDGIFETVFSLAEMPQRGHCTPELDRIGNRDFREIHFKPYRIVYSIRKNEVIVLCVLDGRRDMQTLLQQRLLR
ncbi:MAG: type II toxin-antitoxin system RelE/ParE family toxin [Deltaproteobacteria bacterium]